MPHHDHILYDVAIVGTGPAGCLLAYKLAGNGWSVLLLEKKKLPRYKTCGGGLTRRALNLIPFDVSSVIEDGARTICLRVDQHTAFSQTRPDPAVHLVMRDRFDHLLAQQAVAAGAVLKDQTRFLSLSGPPGNLAIETTRGRFHARIIVGADGVHSRVARAIHLPVRYQTMPALEVEIPLPPEQHKHLAGTIHFDFGVIPGGYGWLFPKRDHVSAGILARRPSAKHLKFCLTRYLQLNGLIARPGLGSLRLHPIPCRPDHRNQYANTRGLIVGDATGLVDPVTGEGIYYALRSAQIAARVLNLQMQGKADSPEAYNRQIKTEIEAETLKADHLARILYRLPALSNRILKHYGDRIGAKHIAVYLGEMSYRQLYRYVLSPRGFAFLLRPRRRRIANGKGIEPR